MILILERVKTGLKKRKVKVFLLFLLFATLAWLIDNLSQTVISNTTFALEYVNAPEDFLLEKAPKKTIDVRLKALGFQFMGFEIRKRKVQIDLSQINVKDSTYYILPKIYRKQIESQLSKRMEMLEMENDTLFIDLTPLISKRVPVLSRTNIDLTTNYMLEDGVLIFPDYVIIKGPKNEVDTIYSIRTSYVDLPNVSSDFSQKTPLLLPKELKKTSVTPNSVIVSGKVYRFSEKVFSVPVKMINVPEDVKVRMFPDHVNVLCQGKIDALKDLKIIDLKVVVDYDKIEAANENRLEVELDSFPKNLSKATLLTKEIEFILRRQ